MRSTFLLALLLLAGCAGGSVRKTTPGTITTIETEPWPEADALFRGNAAWMGGEGGYSIDLGNQRVLWLFGNSFIAPNGMRDRSQSTLVRNSIAIQHGYDPSLARVEFSWRRGGPRPQSFFRREGQDWYWPGHGILLDDVLLVFLMKVGRSDKPPGYDIYGWSAVLVENPGENPDQWKMKFIETPANDMKVIVGSGGVGSTGGYLYAYSAQQSGSRDIYLVRWPVVAASRGDLSRPEWWLGEAAGWAEQTRMPSRPVAVMTGGQTEVTVHEDRTTGQLVQIQTDGTPAADLTMRTARTITGPWSSPQRFHHPPETSRPGIHLQQAKAHPQLQGADMVLTYTLTHNDFATVVVDSTLWYPRFLKGMVR